MVSWAIREAGLGRVGLVGLGGQKDSGACGVVPRNGKAQMADGKIWDRLSKPGGGRGNRELKMSESLRFGLWEKFNFDRL